MKKVFLITLLCLSVLWAFAQGKKVNMLTELHQLESFHDLPKYMSDTKLMQQSSYDTTGNNDDGFSGAYSYIRKNADSSLVIFEAAGSGVINRIWTPTPTDDTLDFYFEGKASPAFSIRFADLFSGKVYPFVAPLTGNELGGYFSYVPIPFKNGCKIVFRGKKMQFYQIQYRTYPADYTVSNFNPELNNAEKAALEAVKQQWENTDKLVSAIKPIHRDTILNAGTSATIANLTQGGRIVGLKFYPAEAFKGLHKQIDLKITWDDEQAPAIYMPIADFFGYAFGSESMQSLLLGTKNNTNYCYFPMPFAKQAKIELVYRMPDRTEKVEPIRIKADIYYTNERYDPAREGKFYAHWGRDPKATLGKPHVFLTGEGKGHYVGTILQAQGLEPGMTLFFEGDDSTQIDGEMRLHGTGSEDYFNGGWYALLDRWDRKMSLPLHGSLDYSLPYARTGGYRLFIADKMPFNKEILHTIEHGPEQNNKAVDYTSVALYYADKAVLSEQTVPHNKITQVYIPDTMMVYPQLIKYSLAGEVKISGDVMVSTTGGKLQIDLSDLPKGRYKLLADIEKSPEGAEIELWQRQKQIGKPISFYSGQRQKLQNEYLANITLDEFKNAVTFHFKRDEAKGKIQFSRLILIREDTR